MLIDEIIDLLSHEQSNLCEALVKTKVLLRRIGKKDLVEWVNHELNGYPEGSDLPEYRVLPSKVLANITNGVYRYQAHPIPIGHISQENRERLERAKIRQPTSVLETFGKDGFLTRDIPMENNRQLAKGLDNDYHIERAWCQTPTHEVRGILTQVRSRLLDFLFDLKESVGDSQDEESIKAKADKVDATSMFNNAIFGSNTTIVVGQHNTQLVRNEVTKGDFSALAQTLTKIGIPADEIDNLKTAISDDQTNGHVTPFEGKTGSWFTKLLARAAKGGLAVGTDVISKVVTDALTAYFKGSV
jgi:hypothetical protein